MAKGQLAPSFIPLWPISAGLTLVARGRGAYEPLVDMDSTRYIRASGESRTKLSARPSASRSLSGARLPEGPSDRPPFHRPGRRAQAVPALGQTVGGNPWLIAKLDHPYPLETHRLARFRALAIASVRLPEPKFLDSSGKGSSVDEGIERRTSCLQSIAARLPLPDAHITVSRERGEAVHDISLALPPCIPPSTDLASSSVGRDARDSQSPQKTTPFRLVSG